MTEYIASSELVGRRPRISRIRAYSSALSPRSAHGWSRDGSVAARATVSRWAITGASGWAATVLVLVSGTGSTYGSVTRRRSATLRAAYGRPGRLAPSGIPSAFNYNCVIPSSAVTGVNSEV